MAKEPASINPPGQSARIWANPKARMALFMGFGLIILMLIWRIVAPSGKNQNLKSKTESDLERIIDKSKKTGTDDKGQQPNIQKKASDQPSGDPEAIAILNTVDARKAAADKRKADAAEQALENLAYQNYSRKMQGLSYDSELAAAWEARMAKAASEGKVLGAPAEITAENLAELKRTNPELYARWIATQGGVIKTGNRGQEVAVTKPGAKGPGAAAPTNIPPGIDPKTGLPVAGGVVVGGTPGLPSDVIFALADDGTPDIAHGAIPVQIQYTPPGSSQPVTLVKWVRPGYLTGRVRPVDPRLAMEEDEAFRRSMKDSTDIPVDPQNKPVGIPYRYTNAKVRVSSGEFNFQNKYVVVLPNPQGQLTPPNPPMPGGRK